MDIMGGMRYDIYIRCALFLFAPVKRRMTFYIKY